MTMTLWLHQHQQKYHFLHSMLYFLLVFLFYGHQYHGLFVLCFPGFDYDFVTCGSALKLLNHYHDVRLHSHDVKYGSGSGQQVS